MSIKYSKYDKKVIQSLGLHCTLSGLLKISDLDIFTNVLKKVFDEKFQTTIIKAKTVQV